MVILDFNGLKRRYFYLFGITNGDKEKRASLAASAGLSFSGVYGQRTMTNEVTKRNIPHLLQA